MRYVHDASVDRALLSNPLTLSFLGLAQSEIVSLHIGQAGVQIGNACWELYTLEHGQRQLLTTRCMSPRADS